MSEDAASRDRAAINGVLAEVADRSLPGVAPRVREAIAYALAGEGKRIRGRLVLAGYRACGGAGDATRLAASVEVVHAYSLVHDDLPCMDDDDVRRGRPSTHRAFDVATAAIAGAVMIPLAVTEAWRGAIGLGLAPREAAHIVARLSAAAGAGGMVGGQLRDLEAERAPVPVDVLESIHRAKTGVLIEACLAMGALAARAGPGAVDALAHFGADLGLAFQIVDDVLDVTASSAELGKTSRRDVVLGKGTYPSLLGVDGAVDRARGLVERACRTIADANVASGDLRALAHAVLGRRS